MGDGRDGGMSMASSSIEGMGEGVRDMMALGWEEGGAYVVDAL